SRGEEEVGAQMCACSKTAVESRAHKGGECEMYKKERKMFKEEMRKIDESDMEKFDTLDSREKAIAILGLR
ncbi:MAG: hypothetical protein ABJX82_10360, partial [Paracoccaceae bacterium]